jgi:hypothetical protein
MLKSKPDMIMWRNFLAVYAYTRHKSCHFSVNNVFGQGSKTIPFGYAYAGVLSSILNNVGSDKLDFVSHSVIASCIGYKGESIVNEQN